MDPIQDAERRPPDALSSDELGRRLVELAGDERRILVEFLLHLEAFDRRRAWLEAGFGSLWDYCREVLHLSEGAAGRRTGAMRVLRRFPALVPALRDGRLSLTAVTLLAPVLHEGNLDALVTQAAFASKVAVQRLVASLQPRPEPRQGVRLVSQAATEARRPACAASAPPGMSGLAPTPEAAPVVPLLEAGLAGVGSRDGSRRDAACAVAPMERPETLPQPLVLVPPPPPPPAAPPRDELRPIDAERWSVRVTLDGRAKADLDLLVELLSHKTGRDLGAVVHEAVRCALEKHGKRRGVVAPSRPRPLPRGKGDAARPLDPRAIPIEVRRAVHARDGGRCTYVAPDGRRCGSRWKLELHHRDPAARGGPPTIENLTLRCKPHNLLAAERDFGAAHVRAFTTREPSAREAVAEYGPGARRLAMGPAP